MLDRVDLSSDAFEADWALVCASWQEVFAFGVGSEFSKGRQVEYVLGEWSKDESLDLPLRIDTACKAIKSFTFSGIAQTMNTYNGAMPKID